MAVLGQPVALGDVRDVEAFVQKQINRGRRRHDPDERDELVAEGLRITWDLWRRFDPHREGYEHAGRFSGFLAKFLPLKLEDAYHRLHPEHVLRACPETGKREWEYRDRAASLDAMTAEDPDRLPVLADVAALDAVTVKRRTHAALFETWTARVKLWSEVAELYAMGATDGDVAEALGMTGDQVRQAKAAIAEAMPRVLGGEQ